MYNWIKNYFRSSAQIQFLIWTAIIYLGLSVVSTIYCYARLDIEASSRPIKTETTKN